MLVASTSLSGTTCSVRIKCEDSDDAVQITSGTDHNGRTSTTAYSDWTVPVMTAGTEYELADFTTALQEVIDRAGWTSGNAIHVFISNNASSYNGVRLVSSLENTSYTEAELIVTYTT